ncbi:MAG: transposase [Smithellaceae bacterium]|jgi:REP element-mobilizing transposase RayT
MARPLRIEYPDAVYHVTARGNAKNDIFHSDTDRNTFLKILSGVVLRYNWLCHAYCLMDNHYHLLIETPDGNLSVGMRQLNGVYTQKHNWLHQKSGHVFQGRFKAIVVEKESYLLELCRYVVLNPVRAGKTETPEQWRWSSYRFTAGMKTPPDYLTTDWILGLFHPKKREAQKLYRKFVRAGIGLQSPWEELRGQILLGEEGFVDAHKDLLYDKKTVKEVPRTQRYVNRPALSVLLTKSATKSQRDQAIHRAYIQHGYTMKAIADHLGIHYTTVSKVIKAQEEN